MKIFHSDNRHEWLQSSGYVYGSCGRVDRVPLWLDLAFVWLTDLLFAGLSDVCRHIITNQVNDAKVEYLC